MNVVARNRPVRSSLLNAGARLGALALLALPLACGGFAPEPRLHGDDDHAELTYSGQFLKEAFSFQQGYYVSPLLESEGGGTRVGFMLDVASEAAGIHLEARGYDAEGAPGEWLPAVFTWAEGQMRVANVELGELSYATEVRVGADEADALLAITYALIIPGEAVSDPGFDALASRPVQVGADLDVSGAAVAQQALISGVNPRSAWGARSTSCSSNPTKTKISVHHTAGPSTKYSGSYAGRIRQIQNFHMDSRGWCDIGYHFLITKDGQAWEARKADRLGAHVGGQNTNNLGVSFVGCFHPTSDCNGLDPLNPPAAMLNKGGEVIGKNASLYGITLRTPSMSGTTTLMGHRDNPGQSTACPGNNLHAKLGELRSIALNGSAAPTTGKVQGVVWDLGVTTDASQSADLGARLAGTTISTSNGQSTTARAGDAYWSFTLNPGTYTITATRDGYAPASREVQVTAGGAPWASIGIAPAVTSADVTAHVFDSATNAAIESATVQVTGADPAQTNAAGEVEFSVNAGALTITAAAEGYEPLELTRTVAAGSAQRVELALVALVVEEPPVEEPPVEEPEDPKDEEPTEPVDESGPGTSEAPLAPAQNDDVERVSLSPQLANGEVAQSCTCVVIGGDSESGDPTRGFALAGLLGLGLLFRRRRH